MADALFFDCLLHLLLTIEGIVVAGGRDRRRLDRRVAALVGLGQGDQVPHLIAAELDLGLGALADLLDHQGLAVLLVELLLEVFALDLALIERVDEGEAALGLGVVRVELLGLVEELAGGGTLVEHQRHLRLTEQLVAGDEVDLLGEGQGPIGTHDRRLVGGLLPLIDHRDEEEVIGLGLEHRLGALDRDLLAVHAARDLVGELLGGVELADDQRRGITAERRQLASG